ncbi:Cys-tRNA(Pro) deacylase [Alkalimarinus sediminis]|uniref:Cys-tRNA(Pro)/Cys-tRNA(Cys) deacylase n=1 Tax=Alkalimarinus sediminis TaxID=1632866 RepID=A0A9E8KNY9_9ALTE|nr:Cys-tRNA(Pro) deacylase [Alkalimarinus sediminis]UZW74873.1 Cys-tRNA(Pro) deacylase [Alkalimarinus sediminis]
MTPAINCAEKAKIFYKVHHYEHDKNANSYGEEAAEKLNLPASRVFKTLVVALDSGVLAVAVIPVSNQLSLKAMASAVKTKKVKMADPKAVERSSGYVLGGVSPLGQKRRLHTVIDKQALSFDTIFVSAGRRGLEIELSPNDLAAVLEASFDTLI